VFSIERELQRIPVAGGEEKEIVRPGGEKDRLLYKRKRRTGEGGETREKAVPDRGEKTLLFQNARAQS